MIPIDSDRILTWDECHWLCYEFVFPSIGGSFKTDSVCVLCASVLLHAAPWVRDGLELDMDWASNLVWTPLLDSLVCSPSLFGMFQLGPGSKRWITSPRWCRGTRQLKILTMWYDVRLDPIEIHQVLMELKLTPDEGVMAWPIENCQATDILN